MIEKARAALEKRGFKVCLTETASQAKEAILEQIGSGSAGFGGSMTIKSMGIYEALEAKGNPVFDHNRTPVAQDPQIFLKEYSADFYLASANALLTDGRMINIDGRGNRVSCIVDGPKQVILVIGKNKLVEGSLENGIARVKKYACGANARRIGLKTPCAANDVCVDCDSPQRICRVIEIIERQPMASNITIYLVNEELGY
jgi:hypothetical protein